MVAAGAAGIAAMSLEPRWGTKSWPNALAAEPRQVPWLTEVQTPPKNLPANSLRLDTLLLDDAANPITTKEAWQKRRATLRHAWLEMLGELHLPTPAVRLQVLEQDHPPGVVRQRVRCESEPNVPLDGYLLRPAQKSVAALPGVVVLHSTVDHTIRQPAGLAGPPQYHLGLQLAQRGMVAFCPRCFLWQDSMGYKEQVARFQQRHPRPGKPFPITGMAKMLWDAARALDVLASLPEVARDRLGAVGHSLGAKEVLYLAAFDERVRAAVASEGGIGTKFSNWDAPWYLGDALRSGKWHREHHELLALTAPRAFLLIGGDSADGANSWPFIHAAMPVYKLLGSPARLGLLNHYGGHALPPIATTKLFEWLETYL